jgi:hypothetical protein
MVDDCPMTEDCPGYDRHLQGSRPGSWEFRMLGTSYTAGH